MNYKIHSYVIGPLENNIHIIEDTQTRKAIVVDPAWNADEISWHLTQLGLNLATIILTHTHYDHVNAVDALLKHHQVPVYAGEHELAFLQQRATQGEPFGKIPADTRPLKDQEIIMLGETSIKIIETPGHTAGGICLLLENDLITGDTLFIDGCGRTDLPGGNAEILFQSLRRIVNDIPHHVTLHTGHAYGPIATTTLASQIKTNPYLKRAERSDFIQYRSTH